MRLILYGCILAAALSGQLASADPLDEPESPRLTALLEEVDAGNDQAIIDFWLEMSEHGTPLVEAVPGDREHFMLTFLWRGDEQTKNVVLFSVLTARANMDFSAKQAERSQLKHLRQTNIWYRTFRVNNDTRLTYYLSPNDPLLPASRRSSASDWETLQEDPLNPNRLVLTHEDRDWIRSKVDLPGAIPVPWIEPHEGTPKGKTEVRLLQSEFLQNERRFWIYTPPGYSVKHGPYSLLVLFDGWTYLHMIPTAIVLENLLAAEKIDPLVVVMVAQRDRNVESSCHKPFNDFLFRELVPWIRENYHVSKETIVGGASRGGLGAVCAALMHPDVFSTVLSQSGYFSWDPREEEATYEEELEFEWIIRQFSTGPKLDLRFVINVGTLEHDRDFPHGTSLLQANRHMRDVLIAKGYDIEYFEVTGGHEIYTSSLTLPASLIAISQFIRAQGNPRR